MQVCTQNEIKVAPVGAHGFCIHQEPINLNLCMHVNVLYVFVAGPQQSSGDVMIQREASVRQEMEKPERDMLGGMGPIPPKC